jgi:3',5'-cyclic-AMP phosphodiesterase
MRPVSTRLFAGLSVAICLTVAGACMRFSPYQIELDDDERDQTARNLQKLAQSPGTPGERFRFGLLSDTHDGYRDAAAIIAHLNNRGDIRLIVHAGDLTDFGSQQEFIWFHQEMGGYPLPFFVAVGNHDGLVNGRKLYQEMFGPPNFVFHYASVKFVVFNTNTIEYDVPEPDLAWLERETNDHGPEEGVIVVTHHPPDSEPHLTKEVQARYRQIQRDAGVLANLHGHIHQDFHVEQDGPTTYLRAKAALSGAFAIVTTDGKSLSWARCTTSACEPEEVFVP